MTAPREFITMPIMRGVPALVKEATDFLIPPTSGVTFVAIGAGPDPECSRAGLLYIGLQTEEGRLITAIVPETSLPSLGDMLSAAADRIRRLDFETPEVGTA